VFDEDPRRLMDRLMKVYEKGRGKLPARLTRREV